MVIHQEKEEPKAQGGDHKTGLLLFKKITLYNYFKLKEDIIFANGPPVC